MINITSGKTVPQRIDSRPGLLMPASIFSFLKQLTLDEEKWEKFVAKAINKLVSGKSDTDLMTSCSANFCALLILFNGEEKAVDFMQALTFTNSFIVDNFFIYNIGSEHAILSANKKYAKNPAFKFTSEYALKSKKYIKCIESIKEGINLGATNSTVSSLDINPSVIKKLSEEIHMNEQMINETTSYMYQVMITAPTINFTRVESEQELIQRRPLACYHAFVLEQAKISTGEVQYYLYQAWYNKLTLAESLNSLPWNKEKLNQFFQFLDELLSQNKTNGNEHLILELEKKCFGVENNDATSALGVNHHLPAISGKSLRYITSKIDIENCKMHYSYFTMN